jgi:hypothetical protein
MSKKIKKNIVNNFFKILPSDNKIIRVVFLLVIVAALIIILYLSYRGVSNAWYMSRIKHDFYKLQDMGLNVKNYNIKYCKYLKKKFIPKTFKIRTEKKRGEFMNKKMIGFIPDKYIVLDIDTKDGVESGNFLIDKIPKDTASEKTPNGYHYYFENDTGNAIHSYVQLDVGGEKYSVDILGVDSLVTMSPSCIDGKSYYWINSIFTHNPAKLSENMWIVDLIKNNKPFVRKFDGFHNDISIKNVFIIIDNLHIESHFRFFLQNTKTYSKKIKLLNGIVYKYDDNYYFMTKNSFNTYKNKKKILNEMNETISKLNISCIVDLSIIYSNYLPSEKIFHINSCIISNDYKNYKYNDLFPDYIEINNIYKKTNYLIPDTITIFKYDSTNLKNEKYESIKNDRTNKILIGSESIYVTTLLSNYFNIPCLCIGATYSEKNDSVYDIINSESSNNMLIKTQRENLNKLMTHISSIF